jgi:hypothetical protein
VKSIFLAHSFSFVTIDAAFLLAVPMTPTSRVLSPLRASHVATTANARYFFALALVYLIYPTCLFSRLLRIYNQPESPSVLGYRMGLLRASLGQWLRSRTRKFAVLLLLFLRFGYPTPANAGVFIFGVFALGLFEVTYPHCGDVSWGLRT